MLYIGIFGWNTAVFTFRIFSAIGVFVCVFFFLVDTACFCLSVYLLAFAQNDDDDAKKSHVLSQHKQGMSINSLDREHKNSHTYTVAQILRIQTI